MLSVNNVNSVVVQGNWSIVHVKSSNHVEITSHNITPHHHLYIYFNIKLIAYY